MSGVLLEAFGKFSRVIFALSSVKGFSWDQTASMANYNTLKEGREIWKRSAEYYIQAADLYPEDDEYHACRIMFSFNRQSRAYCCVSGYLLVGLNAFFSSGAPLKTTLPIMERLQTAVPVMERIWKHSPLAGEEDRAERFRMTLWFAEDVSKALAHGQVTLDDEILPSMPK